ncbi:MAG: amino acid carrier protein [candidate division Zixibacteria bacterium]|nr:amino acid carrier protein [candidate division Zixibacteria bacterium]
MPALIVLLVGTGLITTIRVGFIQFRKVKHGINVIRGIYDNPQDEGDINHFQALSAALSATVGIGNIAGVATAIHYGGPGALFWMWVTGLFGTSLKYVECTLSMMHRDIHPDGSAAGGPMYYIIKGLGNNWKPLAVIFAASAVICSFGTGNAVQAFTVADQFNSEWGIPNWIMGLIVSSVIFMVIVGGIKRIGHVASRLAPAMATIYVLGGITILLLNYEKILPSFALIFEQAFTPAAELGGFAGSTFLMTLVWGVKRGLFSNEAGQGSAPIAHAAAKTKYPIREGVVAMLGPYIDTITICTITGLSIIITGAYTVTIDGQALNGSPMTAYAFKVGLEPILGPYGNHIVTVAVFLFAISTMISWSYYGDRSIQFLIGNKAILPYKIVYCIVNFLASLFALEVVWGFGDAALGIMTIPNLIAILALTRIVKKRQDEYFAEEHVPYKIR